MRRLPFESRRLVLALGVAAATALGPSAATPQARGFDPPPVTPGEGEGRATLHPASPQVGTAGTYVLRFLVGPSGILPGGGLLVDFPKSWFTDTAAIGPRPLLPAVKSVQLDDPRAPHWLGARAARPDVRLELAVAHRGAEGKSERLRHLVWIRVLEGTLHPESSLEVLFANTTAPTLAESETVRVAVDERASGTYRWLRAGATYVARAGPAESLRLFAPSQAVVGRPVELRLVAFDRWDNVAQGAAGLFTIFGLGEEPLAAEYGPADDGILRLRFTPTGEGWLWPTAEGTLFDDGSSDADPLRIRAGGGPIQVLATEPGVRLFWGDLHAHSRISADGIGADGYAYARQVARLDFLAATEHADDEGALLGAGPGPGITEDEWEELRRAAREHHEAGTFVALLGHDCRLSGSEHTLLFPSLEADPLAPCGIAGGAARWPDLATVGAMALARRLGIAAAARGEAQSGESPSLAPRFDGRTPHEPRLRPLLEIYSGFGQTERFDPADPLSAESLPGSPGRSIDGPHFARDAWAAELLMGVAASSADHRAQPGNGGLTAVYAPALERAAIFEALAARRSYATTGPRIVLDFSVSGNPMGSSAEIRGPADGSFTVAAPVPMRRVEVLGYDHRQRWWSVARWERPGRLLSSGFVDSPELPTLYLLRVELEPAADGRAERAWSSPVWVRPSLPDL